MCVISVVIPTYNRGDVVCRAVDSVLKQKFQDFEIIVVDDGSTDETKEKIQSYDDQRIKYVRHDENRGQNIARNTGLKRSTGKYISYLDSDDIFLENHLNTAVETLDELPKKYGGIIVGSRDHLLDGNMINVDVHRGKITMKNLLSGNVYDKILGLSSITFRSSILKRIGYHDKSITKSTDLDFYIQILREYDLYGVNEVLCKRYRREDSVSVDLDNRIDGPISIINKHENLLPPEAKSRLRYDRGVALARVGNMCEARREFINCMRLYPYEPKYIFHYLISYFGTSSFFLIRDILRRFL